MRARVAAAAEVVLCLGTVAPGVLLYLDFFATAAYLAPVAVAASTAALAGVWRYGPWRTVGFAVTAFAVAVTWVYRDTTSYGLPTGDTAKAVVGGVASGWTSMLSVGLPADSEPDLVITPVLCTWCAVYAAVAIATRTRQALAPAVPGLIAFVVALLFSKGEPHLLLAAGFVLASLALVLLRSDRFDTAERSGGGLAFGVPVIVCVATLGAAVAWAVPVATGEDRFDPRTLRPPPVTLSTDLTPLARVKAQLREPAPRPLFDIEVDGAEQSLVRTSALDDYDGVTWSSDDPYLFAGTRLSANTAPAAVTVSARVRVEGLPGPFLPTFGRPVSLDVPDRGERRLAFNSRSGVLVCPEPSLRGLTYSFSADADVRDDSLAQSLPGPGSTDLPDDLPTELRQLAKDLTRDATTLYGKVTALERSLRRLPYDLAAAPGHSLARLKTMLVGEPGTSPGAYAEQHAAAFAVLARAIGVPSRVAVGYRLHDPTSGTYHVTSHDAHAWAEVMFADRGWVAFDPTDPTRTESTPPGNPDPAVIAGPAQPNPPTVDPRTTPTGGENGRPGGGWQGLIRATAVVTIGAVALAVSAAVGIACVKAVRSRRRRAAGGAAGVIAAWREILDRFAERGSWPPITSTPQEVAAQLDDEGLAAVAALVTVAIYAPHELDESAAARAWAVEAKYRRPSTPRGVIALVDPRPLLADRRETRQRQAALRALGTV
ncbi:transglutaminaseTgpA domain-containing protein [Actinokineospora cianjurensis]|uniref:Uncharacterized protein DUF4129 n=1 Tax=Actinokineospora cianjurensis TaxID=585224 RepID=A0A421AU57_9PSEU|nr:DUF3488 and transglutaminase-like domain-containing protein [Actinokineospora cianjurensis]RLK53591.1 uncharacterized protein DUF4129 [Actinokineospora cianjurensis]